MEEVLASLSRLAPDLALIFEHLKPCSLISPDRQVIPYRIFSHVRDYSGLGRMTTYSEDDIRDLLGPHFSCTYRTMDEMELGRTGSNRYFPTPGFGWLSCAIAVRRPDTRGILPAAFK